MRGTLDTRWSLKLIWGRKMRRKRRTVAPFIGQQGAVPHFLEENRLSLHAIIMSMQGGIFPIYGEFVASKEHSEVAGSSAPKVL